MKETKHRAERLQHRLSALCFLSALKTEFHLHGRKAGCPCSGDFPSAYIDIQAGFRTPPDEPCLMYGSDDEPEVFSGHCRRWQHACSGNPRQIRRSGKNGQINMIEATRAEHLQTAAIMACTAAGERLPDKCLRQKTDSVDIKSWLILRKRFPAGS